MSTEIQYSLGLNLDLTYAEVRKLEITLIRILSYAQRLTGDTNLTKLIEIVQRTIVAIRSLQIAIRTLEMAAGPIGWAYAGTTAVAAGLAGYSIYESITGA